MKYSLATKFLVLSLVLVGLSLGLAAVGLRVITDAQVRRLNDHHKALIKQSLKDSNEQLVRQLAQGAAKILYNPMSLDSLVVVRDIVQDLRRSSRIVYVGVWDSKLRRIQSEGVAGFGAGFKPPASSQRLTTRRRHLVVDNRISLAGETVGYLRLVLSNHNVRDAIAAEIRAEDRLASLIQRDAVYMLALVSLVLFLIALVVSRYWSKRIVMPLVKLKAGTQAVMAGQEVESLVVKTGDEIEVLSRSLDQLVATERTLRRHVLAGNQRLKESEARIRGILESMVDALFVLDEERRLTLVNPATAEMFGCAESELIGRQFGELLEDQGAIGWGDGQIRGKDITLRADDGSRIPVSFNGAELNLKGVAQGFVGVARDLRATIRLIEERHQALGEKEKAEAAKKAQEQLTEVAHQAGMAEIATGVLHNIGNVLNTLNISANLVQSSLQESRIPSVARFHELLADKGESLAEFIESPQGRKALIYLKKLADQLGRERTMLLDETEVVLEKVRHIRDIVMVQQNYARGIGFQTPVELGRLLEDCIKVQSDMLSKSDIELEVNKPEGRLDLMTEKAKLMQILVNLIKNGAEAIQSYASAAPSGWQPKLTVDIVDRGVSFGISVADTGVGVDPADRARLFSYGFTTKQGGYGFGLHYCANTIRQLGGTIDFESSGPGRGTSFLLEIPKQYDSRTGTGPQSEAESPLVQPVDGVE